MIGRWAAGAALTCALGLLFAPPAADAQGQTQMLRVGVLGKVFDDLASFRQGLANSGMQMARTSPSTIARNWAVSGGSRPSPTSRS
jgi:hypothetical protein